MNGVLIVNGQAGAAGTQRGDEPTPSTLREAFTAVGIEVRVMRVGGGALDSTVRDVVRQKPDAVFVGGGDGTVSAAARRLVDTGIPLGVVPLGTLNHFATDLRLPGDWRAAVAAFASAPPRAVDVAEVNGHVFINNCSLGAYADAVHRRDALRRTHGHGKWPAMLRASLAVFRELRRHRIHIQTPETSLALRTPLVLIANNRYTGHVLDASLRPRLDEGRLWLYTTRARGRADVLRLVWQTFVRRIDAADALHTCSTTAAIITTTPPRLPAAADGEVIELTSPLQFRIRPGALRVLAPLSPDPA